MPCRALPRLLLAGWLFAAGPAAAVVGGAGVDPNSADSPWAGVGAITLKNGGTFSGALIGPRLVLTAAHVVAGNREHPENVRFHLNYGGDLTQSFQAQAIHVLPQFAGARPGPGGVWFGDMAVVELDARAPPGVPIYPLYAGDLRLPLDTDFTLVGYGAGGDGLNGKTVGSNPAVKRTGRNRPDLLIGRKEGPGLPEVFVFDFDGPGLDSNVFRPADDPRSPSLGDDEAGLAGGDSGSPMFIHADGRWQILGVATFNGRAGRSGGSNVGFGAIGGGTFVAPYKDWLQQWLDQPARQR